MSVWLPALAPRRAWRCCSSSCPSPKGGLHIVDGAEHTVMQAAPVRHDEPPLGPGARGGQHGSGTGASFRVIGLGDDGASAGYAVWQDVKRSRRGQAWDGPNPAQGPSA